MCIRDRSRLDARFTPYVFISPFFLLFLLVGMFPLAYTAFVSVHDWGLLSGRGDYTGLENYRRVLEDRYFWNALRNTVSIFLLSSIPQILIALVLAGLLDWAAARGATTAWLHVEVDNGPALGLYERAGFRTHHSLAYISGPATH